MFAHLQVDQWLDFSTSLVSGAGLEAVCGVVDQFLSLRTYLVGYKLSIADLQIWGQLQGALLLRCNGVVPTYRCLWLQNLMVVGGMLVWLLIALIVPYLLSA